MIYPRIIAHRCGGALAPENTLAGLRLAARLGCCGVEFDAMLAAGDVRSDQLQAIEFTDRIFPDVKPEWYASKPAR